MVKTQTHAPGKSINGAGGVHGVTIRSKYRGVFSSGRKWKAQIYHGGNQVYLGVHTSEEAAAVAYDKMARVIHGSKAVCNFSLSSRTDNSAADKLGHTTGLSVLLREALFSSTAKLQRQELDFVLSQLQRYRDSLRHQTMMMLHVHDISRLLPGTPEADKFVNLVIREHDTSARIIEAQAHLAARETKLRRSKVLSESSSRNAQRQERERVSFE